MRQSTVQSNRNNLVYLQSTQIHENPLNDSVYTSDHEQEDEQLYQSILENGILQPLTVVPHPQLPLEYLLVAGHRRLASMGDIIDASSKALEFYGFSKDEILKKRL